MPAHTGRLILSTLDPFLLPDPTRLVSALRAAGLLGEPLAEAGCAFGAGAHFLQLITFAGCSVRVDLSPNGRTPFCHIRLVGPFAQPRFLSGRNTRPPRCPSCRNPLPDWRDRPLEELSLGTAAIPCPACGNASLPWDYDWKEKAGFGRLFIQVEEVFPGEALPTPTMMKLLHESAGCAWRYFYVQDE